MLYHKKTIFLYAKLFKTTLQHKKGLASLRDSHTEQDNPADARRWTELLPAPQKAILPHRILVYRHIALHLFSPKAEIKKTAWAAAFIYGQPALSRYVKNIMKQTKI